MRYHNICFAELLFIIAMHDQHIKSLFQVVNPQSRVSIDWAYKNLGLFTSTGNPNVTVSWPGNFVCLDAGQTLVIKPGGFFDVE